MDSAVVFKLHENNLDKVERPLPGINKCGRGGGTS